MSERDEQVQRGMSHIFASIFDAQDRAFAHKVMAELGDDEHAKRVLIVAMMTNALRRKYPHAQTSTQVPGQADHSGAPGPEEARQAPTPTPVPGLPPTPTSHATTPTNTVSHHDDEHAE